MISSLGITNNDLEIKIGQMLIVGFRGLEPQDVYPIAQDIEKRHIGGVILFDYDASTRHPVRNIQSPEQVKRLVVSLQERASIPLFIALDQEGGNVNRLKETFGFPPTVSAQYLGSLNQPEVTRKYADITATTLAELGINLNFAPVVDLNINPSNPIIGKFERSFSDDPEIVFTHALEWIKTHHTHNVFCALKHFPGHGSSQNDSHLDFVNVTDTWLPEELIPYSKLIPTGECDLVMIAHVFHSKFDPLLPATLSAPIITGLLRKTYQYDGVVISDDMQMKAISSHYSFETALQAAIEAGVDLFIFGNNLVYEENIAAKAVAVIKQLVVNGTISQERIDQSYRRICRIKEQL